MMKNKLRNCAVSCLAVFFVSLLIFSAVMPYFGIYLAALSVVEWLCILMYGRRENYFFFLQVFPMVLGNAAAFILLWFSLGREISLSNIDTFEFVLLAALAAGAIYTMCIIVPGAVKDRGRQKTKEQPPKLFPERKYDLCRLTGFLKSGSQLTGLDAQWGEGKTFLIDQLCASPQVRDQYEIVRINVLAGNEDELELTLMNEFDRILRRNRIFSLASKQMLKLLESSDILKQIQWVLIEDTQSVSATFSHVLNDLEKLSRNVLIIVDDIERLGDEALIRKLFALMESVSSSKVQILYLFNSQRLTGLDRSYLEKYIPCYMNLTPISFSSIVRELWSELKMDTTGTACDDVEKMAAYPDGSFSIKNILALDSAGTLRPFRLDNITVRRVRTFLEEFRNLSGQKSAPESGISPSLSRAEEKILLKCLFIKHFLNDDFKTIMVGVSIVECFSFRLNEEAKAVLREFHVQAPDSITLPGMFDIRRRLGCAENMQRFMKEVLSDNDSYNRLAALSMLDYNYADIWQEICEAERPRAKRTVPAGTADGEELLNPMLIRAEQIGNEDISNLEQERHNEQIDRVMWNLLANGTSELPNPDAYVRHFQQCVLSAEPSAQEEMWGKFLSDSYHGKIYKNNVTRDRFGVDKYLPLFQGFRVVNAAPGQWLKLIDFYFQREAEKGISVEMLQNLNYVDMMDHRVYICVLNAFCRCPIIGNLNREPSMYRFLRQTLRLSFTLGYTKHHQFHDLWYLGDDPVSQDSLVPSRKWNDLVMELASRFDAMKSALEQDKLDDSRFPWFNSDIDSIINFISKCQVLTAKEKPIGMRTLHVEVKETHSKTRHEELCDTLLQKLRSGMDADEWHKEVCSEFEEGNLDPLEVRRLIQAEKEGV